MRTHNSRAYAHTLRLCYHSELDTDTIVLKIFQSLLLLSLTLHTNTPLVHRYPLGYAMSKDVRKNDLSYYQNVTDVNGPAMTWSMFAANYGDIGDDSTAASFFGRGYQQNS